jgi:hypothetical protein
MPSLLLTSSFSAPVQTEVDIDIHVHKRTERFVYRNTVAPTDVPLSYIENELPLSRELISVLSNSPLDYTFGLNRSEINTFTGSSYSTRAPVIEATNKFITDINGKREPLWYKHKLPAGAQGVTIRKTSQGEVPEYTGVLVDLAGNAIYTNYRNYFNSTTGAWLAYWVDLQTEQGANDSQLLSPVPAVSPGTWEDLDENGAYPLGLTVYDREVSGIGYEYVFNTSDTYWVRDAADAALTAKHPANMGIESSWYLQVTAGDVSYNGHRYRITEWGLQPFFPSAPNRRVSLNKLSYINETLAYIGRRGLIAEQNPLYLYGYEADGTLVEVHSTDPSLSPGATFNDVAIQQLINGGGDADSGLIWVPINFKLNRNYYIDYTYIAVDYEFSSLELNPLLNPKIKDGSYFVYCLPDLADGQTSLHWLYIKDGVILEASQGPGGTYDNLQMVDEAGDINPDSVIGLTINDLPDFITDYAVYPIAIVGLKNIPKAYDIFSVDVRRFGPQVGPDAQEVFKNNPRALYTDLGYGLTGEAVPGPGVVVADVPISVLEAHGGLLSEAEARKELERFLPVTSYLVLNWTYPKPVIEVKTETPGAVEVTAKYDGDGSYKFLRRDTVINQWSVLDTATVTDTDDILFEDLTCLSGYKYFYAVQVDDFPVGNQIRVEVI